FRVVLSLRYLHPVGKENLRTNIWLLEVNSTQSALKRAARKALIIRSSGLLVSKFSHNSKLPLSL
ncbi:hypothetical protein L1D50_17475, partial [Pseudoalteromonas sp. Isolate6]|uniref:hypothetical protein n=1 Tax=Pseudoalteromonas sp. Isolate6 TaxID=2908527 RepID=UPI001EFDFED3